MKIGIKVWTDPIADDNLLELPSAICAVSLSGGVLQLADTVIGLLQVVENVLVPKGVGGGGGCQIMNTYNVWRYTVLSKKKIPSYEYISIP